MGSQGAGGRKWIQLTDAVMQEILKNAKMFFPKQKNVCILFLQNNSNQTQLSKIGLRPGGKRDRKGTYLMPKGALFYGRGCVPIGMRSKTNFGFSESKTEGPLSAIFLSNLKWS